MFIHNIHETFMLETDFNVFLMILFNQFKKKISIFRQADGRKLV